MEPQRAPARRSVLVVNADEELFGKIAPLLDRQELEVDRFPRASAALELVSRVPVDVLIVGYPLPDVRTQEFLDACAAPASPCRQSPLLLLAHARASSTRPKRFIGRGANEVVAVEESAERLQAAVSRLLAVAPRSSLRDHGAHRRQHRRGRGAGDGADREPLRDRHAGAHRRGLPGGQPAELRVPPRRPEPADPRRGRGGAADHRSAASRCAASASASSRSSGTACCGCSASCATGCARRAATGARCSHWLVKSEPEVYSFDDLMEDDGAHHLLARRAQLPGAQPDARDEGAATRCSSTTRAGAAARRRHRSGGARGLPRRTRRGTRESEYHDPASTPGGPALVHGRRAGRARAAGAGDPRRAQGQPQAGDDEAGAAAASGSACSRSRPTSTPRCCAWRQRTRAPRADG